MPTLPFVSTAGVANDASNTANAWALWNNGLVAAANIDINAATDTGSNMLYNLATKRGYNAVRLFLGDAYGPAHLNDVQNVAALGWADASNTRGSAAGGSSLAALALRIDNILALCKQTGMGLILAVGQFYQDANSAGSLWESSALQAQLLQFWTNTAARWPQGTAGLLGFEILNEPKPGMINAGTAQASGLFYNQMRGTSTTMTNYPLHNWTKLAQNCIAAIRTKQPDLPIVIDTIDGGSALGFEFFRKKLTADVTFSGTAAQSADHFSSDYSGTDTSNLVPDTRSQARLVYSFHMYHPMSFTHQGIYSHLYQCLGTPYPGIKQTDWAWYDGNVLIVAEDFSSAYVSLQDSTGVAYACRRAKAFKNDFKVPVFVGELSAVDIGYINEISGSPYVPASDVRRQITGFSLSGSTVTAALSTPVRIDAQTLQSGTWGQTNNLQVSVQRSSDNAVVFSNVCATFVNAQNGFTFALPSGITLPSNTQGPYYYTIALAPLLTANVKARAAYVRDVLLMCHDAGFSWGWQFEYDNGTSDNFWRPGTADMRDLLARSTARNFKR